MLDFPDIFNFSFGITSMADQVAFADSLCADSSWGMDGLRRGEGFVVLVPLCRGGRQNKKHSMEEATRGYKRETSANETKRIW